MKRIHFKMKFVFILFMFLLFTPGCYKLYDYINTYSREDLKVCNIEKITTYSPPTIWFDSVTAIFSYNSNGDPTYISVSNIGTGNPKRLFKYDQFHRLTDYIGVYDNGYFEYWHKYVYGNNHVLIDSMFEFGSYDTRPASYHDLYIHYLFYDNKERIIKDSMCVAKSDSVNVQNYIYNAEGNKLGYIYDSKLNFHRTNKVWMLIDRDYSLNNPFASTDYNNYNLPLTINQNTNLLGFVFVTSAKIKYMCN